MAKPKNVTAATPANQGDQLRISIEEEVAEISRLTDFKEGREALRRKALLPSDDDPLVPMDRETASTLGHEIRLIDDDIELHQDRLARQRHLPAWSDARQSAREAPKLP
jgi:hypothetical protein